MRRREGCGSIVSWFKVAAVRDSDKANVDLGYNDGGALVKYYPDTLLITLIYKLTIK